MMSKITWSEFIIVWFTLCLVIDIVLQHLYKNNETQGVSEAEERTARIKQLYTPYRDDVFYEAPLRRVSMSRIEAFEAVEDVKADDTYVNLEDSDKHVDEKGDELTELQQETSDIVKMLFG